MIVTLRTHFVYVITLSMIAYTTIFNSNRFCITKRLFLHTDKDFEDNYLYFQLKWDARCRWILVRYKILHPHFDFWHKNHHHNTRKIDLEVFVF